MIVAGWGGDDDSVDASRSGTHVCDIGGDVDLRGVRRDARCGLCDGPDALEERVGETGHRPR